MAGTKRKANEIPELEAGDAGPVPVPPYDVTKETSAKSVVTSDEYNKLKKGIKHVARRITEPLKKSEYCDASSVVKVVNLTEQRLEENVPETIMVTIGGNMGSGKSSTINSIFSVGMIARSDKSGSSVTLVPHLYCGPLTDQTKKFMVEVQFFNQQERQRFFAAELAAFYRAGCQDDRDDGDMSPRRTNGDDDDIDTRDTVIEAPHSLFLEHKECKTKRTTRDFLKSARSEEDKDILKTLNRWADNLIQRIAGDQEFVVIEASTPQEMLKNVEPYSTEITDDDNQRVLSLWPLVKLIKVHFDNPLSRMGVSILDAPGSSDNHIRRETALALKRECSHAAVVVSVARANNEGSASKEVNAAKGKGEGRVVVIVTGSDDIDPNTLVGGNNAERQRVAQLRAFVERLQNEANALMFNLASGDMEAFKKKLLLDLRLHKAQNAERAARIVMRSEHTRARLQEKLRDITGSPVPIPVISVSNLDYQKHLAGYNTMQAPTLSVEQTQIPEVRRLFAQFPNEARLSEIHHLFKAVLPSAIQRVELFSARNASDRKADVVAHVERATKRYEPIIRKAFDRVLEYIEVDILTHVRSIEDAWDHDAGELCDDWKLEYKSSPFLSLMNRNVLKRNNRKSGAVNLSGKLVEIARPSISEIFSDTTNQTLRKELQAALQDIISLVGDMKKDISRDDSAALVNIQPFLDYLSSERPIIRLIVTNHEKGFFAEIDMMKARLTTEVEDAYLVKEMLPVYEKIRVIKGGKDKIMEKPKIGWGPERHLRFKAEVTAINGIWSNTCTALEQDFKSLVKGTKNGMTQAVGEVFNRFLSTLDQDCDTPDLDEPTQKALQSLLRTCLEEVNEYVKTELNPAWEALN